MIKIYELATIKENQVTYCKNIYLFGFIPIYIKESVSINESESKQIGFQLKEKEST